MMRADGHGKVFEIVILAILFLVAPTIATASTEEGDETSFAQPFPYTVRGTVVTVEGAPIPDARVDLWRRTRAGSHSYGEVHTDEQGEFVIGGYWFGSFRRSTWRIEVAAPGFAHSIVDELWSGHRIVDLGHVYLHDPVPVTGTVRDGEGRAIAGALVWAIPGTPEVPTLDILEVEPVATTDLEGRFRFESFPPGTCSVGASASGFADQVRWGTRLEANGNDALDFVLKAVPRTRVRVTDLEGNPLPEAMITRHEWDPLNGERPVDPVPFWRGPVFANHEGMVVLEGMEHPAGEVVFVRAKGHLRERVHLLGRPEECYVRLSPGVTIEWIAEGMTEDPHYRDLAFVSFGARGWVESNEVIGNGEEIYDLWSPARLERRSRGHWTIEWDQHRKWTDGSGPHAMHADMLTGFQPEMHFFSPDEWETGTVVVRQQIAAPGSVRGTVVDIHGEPIPDLLVSIGRSSPYHRKPTYDRTGSHGEFVFEGVGPRNHYGIYVVDPRFQEERIPSWHIEAGENITDLRIVAVRRPRLNGRLTIDGKPPREPLPLTITGDYRNELLAGGPIVVGITGDDGLFSLPAWWTKNMYLVPKRPTGPEAGGYRNFRSEFPKGPARRWPYRGKGKFENAEQNAWIEIDIDSEAYSAR